MQKKIIITIIFHVITISATLGIISYLALHDSIDRSLSNRLALAKIISNHVEVFLNNNLNRLYDLSLPGKINLKDANWVTEKRMLETAYKYSPFTEGVFFLDKYGNEILVYPHHINISQISRISTILIKCSGSGGQSSLIFIPLNLLNKK